MAAFRAAPEERTREPALEVCEAAGASHSAAAVRGVRDALRAKLDAC